MKRPLFRGKARASVLRRARAALSILFAWVLLAGMASAGSRYFYCHVTHELRADSCCDVAGEDVSPTDDAPQATLTQRECCSARTLPALPGATTSSASAPPTSPLVAMLPARAWVHAAASPVLTAADQTFSSSIPPPRSASERRARLMVFLT